MPSLACLSSGRSRAKLPGSQFRSRAPLQAVLSAASGAESPPCPAGVQSCAREKSTRQTVEDSTESAKLQTLPIEYLQYLRSPERVTSADWFGTLLLIPKSRVLDRISGPLLWMTVVATVISTLHCCCGMPGLPTMQVHTLLGSGLSLLLVFRTNSAYQRFQEGRKIWNDILDLTRDLALSVGLFRKEAGPKRIRIIRTSIQAFPFAMQEHVRAKESTNIKQRLNWLLEEMHQARLELSGRSKSSGSGPKAPRGPRPPNRPLHIISRLLNVVNSIPDCEGTFTNRERVWLLSMVTALSHTVGRCERLVQTPVPLSYARHTARFVSVWTLTLPFALVSSYRWLTGPCVAFVTWALFGILEIGNLIEALGSRAWDLGGRTGGLKAKLGLAVPCGCCHCCRRGFRNGSQSFRVSFIGRDRADGILGVERGRAGMSDVVVCSICEKLRWDLSSLNLRGLRVCSC
ncbi:unnamed protein product [Symbiodinium sp. CCMP2592]|nr:unnamed protein product [Symbiodinium sp. CCMP2592]